MNIFFDVILFVVSLAINSLLLGLVVTGGAAMAFQLIRTSFPRLRYTLAVAAFVIAAFVPVAVTLAGTDEPQSPPIKTTITEEGHSRVVRSDIKSATNRPSTSAGQDQMLVSPRASLLNDLTLYVSGSWFGTLFSGIWVFFSIHLLLREIAGYRQLRNERKTWRLANAEQRQRFFCPDNITLYFAEEGFFTTGFFSSAIVLPHHFPENLSRLSIRGIVLHEIAHAKWRDACISSLLRIVRGLFWVNPSLWFLDRTIRAEREAAADRSALAAISNLGEAEEANADYATAIVSIAKLFATGESPHPSRLAAIHFGEATNLENRIHRILNGGSQPKWVHLSFGLVIFLTSVLALTAIPVASISLTRVQAEIPPAAFSEAGKSNASDFSRSDFQPSLQWNDEPSKGNSPGQAPVNVLTENTTSTKTDDKQTKDQDAAITSAARVVEQKEVKVNEPRIQTSSSVPTPTPVVVYQGDSAKPILRRVHQDINRNVNRQDSTKPVMRVVVRRPVIRINYQG